MKSPAEQLKILIDQVNMIELHDLLAQYPALANEGIPFDENNPAKAHPLHRICDGVFEGKYTDNQAVEMTEVFLEAGAHIDGFGLVEKQDTPLIAAASLQADEVALYYIKNGATIHHAGCHGGTALHWAAWCGRDKIVTQLIKEGADINKRCMDFTSTPLFWAVHGLKNGGGKNKYHQVECVRLLMQAGADQTIPNAEGMLAIELLQENELELYQILS